jgi:hypothetical protein
VALEPLLIYTAAAGALFIWIEQIILEEVAYKATICKKGGTYYVCTSGYIPIQCRHAG